MTGAGRGAVLRAWVPAVALAELVGFTVPLVVGALAAQAPTPVVLPALTVAGAGEGAVLGWGQARVLRRFLPAIEARRWTVRTAAGAACAYALGLLPSLTVPWWAAWPSPLVVIAGGLLGAVLVSTIGLVQWPELRGHVRHAERWVAWSALAWAAGLGAFLVVATPLWVPDEPLVGVLAVGLLATVLMALTAATVSGLGLAALLPAR